MIKFFVDAYADMFEPELSKNGMYLAPSKIKHKSKMIEFSGYNAELREKLAKISLQDCAPEPLTQDEWLEFFNKEAAEGNDILYFAPAFRVLSDNGEAIINTFKTLQENYPNQKIMAIDTHTVSRGISEIAFNTKKVYEKSKNLDTALEFANTIIEKYVSLLAVDSATNLKNSPVFSTAMKNFTGATLNIRPILCADTNCKFRVLDKAKTFPLAVSKLYSNTKLNGLNIADYTFSIVHYQAEKEAKELYDRFRKIVGPSEIRLVEMSLNNAILVGGKCVGITFHSRY